MAIEMVPIFDENDRRNFFKAINRRYQTGKRNYAIFLLMINCGLRISEVVGHETRPGAGGLRIGDIDFNTGQITIRDAKDTRKKSKRPKRAKAGRIVYAAGETLDSLRAWWEVRAKKETETDHFFITFTGQPVAPAALRMGMLSITRRANIERAKAHPHALRHTFGTELYRHTKDIRLVQKVLGHTSIANTEIYTHLSGADIEQAMKDYQKEL